MAVLGAYFRHTAEEAARRITRLKLANELFGEPKKG